MSGQTLIRGSTQILAGSITADRFVTGLALATSQLADGSKFIKSDGTVSMAAALNLGGYVPTNAGTPVNASDVATKSYVDAFVNGLTFKQAVKVISAANITLSGLQTIDGVTLAAGNRVLCTAQTNGVQNGFWVAASGSWTRPSDWASGASEAEGVYVLADPDGTTYKNTKWYCTNTGTITVDTTATTWQQDSSGGSYTNGSGLKLTGTTFSVANGAGLSFDGSNNLQVSLNANGLLSTTSGLGIAQGSSAQVIVANSSGNPAWATLSGDVTISNAGVTAVNNTSGSGYTKYTNFIWGETPSGSINGTNTTFTLANTPVTGSIRLYWNGQRQNSGTGNDYTISGGTLTTTFVPVSGDVLLVDYAK